MKIFLSCGHDSNAPLIENIKEHLSKVAEGNLKHEVWIDSSEIKVGKDWRENNTKVGFDSSHHRYNEKRQQNSEYIQ